MENIKTDYKLSMQRSEHLAIKNESTESCCALLELPRHNYTEGQILSASPVFPLVRGNTVKATLPASSVIRLLSTDSQ